MPIEREDETRYLRRILVENWTAVSGYGPDSGLSIHTGEPDDTSRDPQIVIDNVNETPQGESGYAAMAGDGTGFVRQPDGTADIRCVAGTDSDVDPHPRWLTGEFAKEVQRILHSNWRGIPDVHTGDVEYRALAPGSYRGPDSDPDAPGRWFAVQEVQYTYSTKYNR